MMIDYLYPVSRDFLRTHGGGNVDYCWEQAGIALQYWLTLLQ